MKLKEYAVIALTAGTLWLAAVGAIASFDDDAPTDGEIRLALDYLVEAAPTNSDWYWIAAQLRGPHPADMCREDEAWTAVDWQTPGGNWDRHGVTRMCVNTEEIGK